MVVRQKLGRGPVFGFGKNRVRERAIGYVHFQPGNPGRVLRVRPVASDIARTLRDEAIRHHNNTCLTSVE